MLVVEALDATVERIAEATIAVGGADAFAARAGNAKGSVGVRAIALGPALDAFARQTDFTEVRAVLVGVTRDARAELGIAVFAGHATAFAKARRAAFEALKAGKIDRTLRTASVAVAQPLVL
ncbi:MAG TPA: hypothetical protein VFU02_09345, partial [Polyangiaceae bacterium]|nr:hypothetical protein [Polyangiaceae bacterium]